MNKFNPFENFMKYMKRDFTTFDMSNFVQTSMNLGELNAVRTDFVLPSDYWKGQASSAVMLPPLVAPAFTRINGYLQSFYVSFPSIWKYWNQFLSNRPSDAYLNSANTSKFDGVYQEPCIPMSLIQLLLKVYYGYIQYSYYNDSANHRVICETNTSTQISKVPYFYFAYSVVDGLRKYTGTPILDPDTHEPVAMVPETYFDSNADIIRLFDGVEFGMDNNDFAKSIGFYDYSSFIVHQLSLFVKCCKNSGLPCELIASSPFGVYDNEVINALPFFAISKIWSEYYRNPAVQGCELDYSETNGLLCDWYVKSPVSVDWVPQQYEKITQRRWQLRISDIPYRYTDNIWISIYSDYTGGTQHGDILDYMKPIAVLTGIGLRKLYCYKTSAGSVAGVKGILNLLPNYYNGLMVVKYRNFENDYFTSAAPDPMMGRTSIAVPSTLEELRAASKKEEFLESNTAARNFFDFMRHHFGTVAKSVLYQRPDFLGASKIPIQISENLQTSQSTNDSALGTRSGVGSAFTNGSLIQKNFDEHGVIITFLSFVIDNQYFQGLPFELEHHRDYFDLPWPEFANLGLERINNSELFYGDPYTAVPNFFNKSDMLAVSSDISDPPYYEVTPNAVPDEPRIPVLRRVFGYTPRYSKYKFKMDRLSGQFTDSMNFWNTFRIFRNMPKLSHNFISYENAVWMSDLDRIFAVSDSLSDKFQVDLYLDYSVSRCLPLVANPTLN